MTVEVSIDNDNQYLQVKGELICDTVMQALNQLTRQGKDLSSWVIDFTGVARVDSTAVALLIELKKFARETNKTISFIYLPESLLSIARLSQVESLITENN
jgi:ABC-type transporter Mla MlaB component